MRGRGGARRLEDVVRGGINIGVPSANQRREAMAAAAIVGEVWRAETRGSRTEIAIFGASIPLDARFAA